MKLNTESTKTDRLRLIVGSVLAVAGVATIIFGGAILGYSDSNVWLIGGGLLIVGILVAKSMQLIQFLTDIAR